MNVITGYHMFRLRQFTGIPMKNLAEVAAAVAYETLKNNEELKQKLMETYSIRTPEKQLEIDLKKGYEKLI
jgi:hypothetical protein